MTPERQACEKIDELLTKAGWIIQNPAGANIPAGLGVALRGVPLPGHGFADYLLYVNRQAAKPVLAERFGVTRLALFGSTARGDARPDSGVDVVVS